MLGGGGKDGQARPAYHTVGGLSSYGAMQLYCQAPTGKTMIGRIRAACGRYLGESERPVKLVVLCEGSAEKEERKQGRDVRPCKCGWFSVYVTANGRGDG